MFTAWTAESPDPALLAGAAAGVALGALLAAAACDAASRKSATGPGNLTRRMELFRVENFILPSRTPPLSHFAPPPASATKPGETL